MNQSILGSVITPGVTQDYYFYPLITGQTKAEVSVAFTANQSASYMSAQKTGANTYTLGASTPLTASQSGVVIPYTSPNPANAASPATPYGVMVRVAGASAAAPANEPFTARVATSANSMKSITLINDEVFSGYYPSWEQEVANYIKVSLKVTGDNGAIVPGELVTFMVQRNSGDSTTIQSYSGTTDDLGNISWTATFPNRCYGTINYAYNYGPGKHWDGSSQEGLVRVQTPNSTNPVISQDLVFLRMCTETYHPSYPPPPASGASK